VGFWIGVALVVLVVAGLCLVGNRRRGSNQDRLLSRARDGGRAERGATGSTVTGNIQNTHGPSGL
jgi:hypothetical protein